MYRLVIIFGISLVIWAIFSLSQDNNSSMTLDEISDDDVINQIINIEKKIDNFLSGKLIRTSEEISEFRAYLNEVRPNFAWDTFLETYFIKKTNDYEVIPKQMPVSLINRQDIYEYTITREEDVIIFKVTFNYFQNPVTKIYRVKIKDGKLIIVN